MKNRNTQLKATAGLIIPLLLGCSVLLTSVSSSLADLAQTYHGTFTGGDFFCDGELLDPPPHSVSGTWNLNIDPQTPAQLTLNVFYDGREHLSWGYSALTLVWSCNGVYVFTGFGGSAIARLDTNVTPMRFSWQVELGVSCPDQYPYSSLIFLGVGNRGGG